MSAAPNASTMVHAIELVVAAHRAKLSEPTLLIAERIARAAGVTREQLQRAVARGVSCVLLGVLAAGCTAPAPAAAASVVTPPADTVITMDAGVRIPGARYLGKTDGIELWDVGDAYVRVRRTTRPPRPEATRAK